MQDIKDIQSVLQDLLTATGTKSPTLKPGYSGPIQSNPEFEYKERIYKVLCADLIPLHRKTYKLMIHNICIYGCVYHPIIHKRVGCILRDDLHICSKCDYKCFEEDIKDNICIMCR